MSSRDAGLFPLCGPPSPRVLSVCTWSQLVCWGKGREGSLLFMRSGCTWHSKSHGIPRYPAPPALCQVKMCGHPQLQGGVMMESRCYGREGEPVSHLCCQERSRMGVKTVKGLKYLIRELIVSLKTGKKACLFSQ